MALATRFCSFLLPAHYLGLMHNGIDKVSCKWNGQIQRKLSYQRSWSAGSAKVIGMLKNDPFIKLSLSLCVIVLGGTLAMELYNKYKKKTSRALCLLPPTFSHHSIRRTSVLGQLENKLQEVRAKNNGRYPVLYVTGPAGCGKTQVLYQYCNHFMVSHQYKWLGMRRVSPVVLYLDATSPDTLTSSLTEAAKQMGIGKVQLLEENLSTIMSTLALKREPWLLVVDNVTDKTKKMESFAVFEEHLCNSAVGSNHGSEGTVLVGSQARPTDKESMSIPSRLTKEEASELLVCMGDLKDMDCELALLESLACHPMATALAAATFAMYQTTPTIQATLHSGGPNVISTYNKLLVDRTGAGEDVLQAALGLFLEVSVSDARLRHTYDLLGSLDLDWPLLAAAIPVHLSSEFYAIPKHLLSSPPKPSSQEVKENSSYFDIIKARVPFLQTNPTETLPHTQDELSFLRACPVFSFKQYSGTDIELITVHSSAIPLLQELFLEVTCPKLDKEHVKLKAQEFQKNAWFRKYRTFDEQNCLVEFHRGLPGLASPGVLTAREFASLPVQDGTCQMPNLHYSEYVHIVSHYHRVTDTLLSTLKSVKGEVSGYFLEKSLLPHINAVKTLHLLSQADKVAANISVLSIQAASLSCTDVKKCLSSYEHLVNEQRMLLGSQSMAVSCSLTDYADLLISTGNASRAKEVLQSVISNYKKLPAGARDQMSLDIGHAKTSLGLAYTQLGENRESKNCYEEALASYQTAPVQGQVSKTQQKLMSSLLIDVTRSHLILGDLSMAKKYSELGILVLQSLYPNGNLETVRLLEISGIIYSLRGDKEVSSKMLAQASKIKTKVNSNLYS